ncbi:MAG TPA: ribosome biogenesis GTPase Der [Myxococcales bacterium]|nr:ribosome biogenesis GTPase Der [Myxococcales bacterium]
MLPLVALVGRPNVGKSTLFNRIVGKRLAIVEDVPGVTRDRQYAEASQGTKRFRVVDTGGFTPHSDEQLVRAVREQAEAAVREADAVVLVVDAVEGLSGADRELARLLRKGGKPVFLAANKVDSNRRQEALDLGELHAEGFDVFPLSAEHGRGVDELLDAVAAKLPEAAAAEEGADAIHLAVLGRPNVGKSTLLNRLLGEERFVASAMPGTTRDAVDEELLWKGRRFVLTDTAGLRKKRQVVDKVEVFSAQRALRAVERADVVVVLTDATQLGVDQDARIAAQAEERGRAVILCVNKWDLVKDKEVEARRLKEEAQRHLQHVGFAPMLFVSALTGSKVHELLELAAELRDEAATRIPTPQLNGWVQEMQDQHPAPLFRGFPVRFSYAWQVGTRPVTIAIQCNRPQAVDDAYRRFLLHRLQERFGLRVPVRLVFRQKSRATPRGSGARR